MSHAVSGVHIVTTDGPGGRLGLTVSAMVSLSADPPMLLVCINRRSPICNAILANRCFMVNVLSDRQRHVADTFSGRPQAGELAARTGAKQFKIFHFSPRYTDQESLLYEEAFEAYNKIT